MKEIVDDAVDSVGIDGVETVVDIVDPGELPVDDVGTTVVLSVALELGVDSVGVEIGTVYVTEEDVLGEVEMSGSSPRQEPVSTKQPYSHSGAQIYSQ